jgi:hypothetical protein
LKSLLKAAIGHKGALDENYKKIMETIMIMLMHTKKIKYNLTFITIKKAVELCNGKFISREEVKFMTQIGENFQGRG